MGEVEGSGGLQVHTGGVFRPRPRGVARHTPGGVSQHALRLTPQQMATTAGSMHPTGMHSCSFLSINFQGPTSTKQLFKVSFLQTIGTFKLGSWNCT